MMSSSPEFDDAEQGPAAAVAVYCGSGSGSHPMFFERARELGAHLASLNISLVYGGGDVGMMGAVADAAISGGGEVIGVIPQRLVDVEVAHHGVTRLEVTANMHERKMRMIELAGGFIAMPGGFGTYEEVFEVLTWNQLGIISAPVVFLDVGEGSESFWQPMMQFLDGAVAAGLLKGRYRAFVHLTSSVDEAVRIATGPAPTAAPKWSDVTKSARSET
jgi:uncharacterized protein (TIGR00730 family)